MCTCRQKKNQLAATEKRFPNFNPFVNQKKITVFGGSGVYQPVKDAVVKNLTTGYFDFTDEAGVANIPGMPDEQISISHVSFDTEQFDYADLPKVLNLQTGYLDEAVVTTQVQPKAASFAILGVIALGVGAAMYYKNKQTKGLKAAVPVTL